MSLTHAERTDARDQKAKDCDGLEIFCKIHRVGTPKVHTWKLPHDPRSICGEVRLVLHVAT